MTPLKPLCLQQYQSAIRSHKAGKAVDFDELPVPPGEIRVFKPDTLISILAQ